MSEQSLSVQKREGIGRGHSRRLRAQGRIPAVIYGASGSTSLSVGERDFLQLMRKIGGGASIVTLKFEGGSDSLMSLVHDAQRNPRTDRFEHIDFLEVQAGHEITAHLPVHTKGEPVGVKTENGTLEIHLHEVEIKCLPKDLPESITLDVSELHVGEAIHIQDLPAMPGVTFEGDPETVVVSVAEQAEEEPEAPAEEVAADSVPASEVKEDGEDSEKKED